MSGPKNQYRFEYDGNFFNPGLTRTEDARIAKAAHPTDPVARAKFEVPADVRYIRPTGDKSWHEVKVELDRSAGQDCKLLFIVRHGHAEHNKLQAGWPRPVYDRFISQNPKYANSALTETGMSQAAQAGTILRNELQDNHVFPDLWPGSIYTSPLRRCIETAAAIRKAGNSYGVPPSEVYVADNLREWLGYNHHEQNDTRGTKEEIKKHAKSVLQVQPKFVGYFPEDDQMFNRRPLQETWSQVDERWEAALNLIFETDLNKVICICGNNRSIQSGLRVVGHEADQKVLQDNFGIMNMGNGAMIALLVKRQVLDTSSIKHIRLKRQKIAVFEESIIKNTKTKDDNKAEEAVKAMAPHRLKQLLELLAPQERDMVLDLQVTARANQGGY